MLNRLNTITLAILALSLPVAVLANVTGTPTLNDNSGLSLDTGTISTTASSGDIYWNGTSMTPEGSATIYNLEQAGAGYSSTFSSLTQSILATLSSAYTKTPVPATTLIVGDIFLVHTNGGNYSAVVVTAVNGLVSAISLQFITFVSAPSGPVITEIENNYGEIPPGFVNSGIAPGAIFFIVGTGMATPGSVAVIQSSVGANLPATLNGASVKVTAANGTTTVPAFYYAEPTALGLVLPSGTPLGAAQVTVSYGGQTSAPFSINVVQNAFGIDAYFGAGTGLAIAVFTNGTPAGGGCAQQFIACYTLSIPPGTAIELYGSGLGADPKPARDTTYVPVTSAAADSINALAHIYIGGVDAPISYQGASGYPGLNQINLTVPVTVPTGCNVSVVGVSTTGVPTNFLTLPIGTGTCSDPIYGTNGTQLQNASGQANYTSGSVDLFQSTAPATSGSGTTTTSFAQAIFASYTGSSYASAASSGQLSIPGCLVTETATGAATGTTTYLDAGTITVTGPSGQAATLTENSFPLGGTNFISYSSQLAAGYIPTTGGTFTFKATGSTTGGVGPFTTTVVFSNPILQWTNQAAAATVTRSAGLPITWTGGAAGTFVVMSGSSSSTVASGTFTCIANVTAGSFTVPAYVLAALPAGTGTVSVDNETVPNSFTATNLNNGGAVGFVAYQVNSTYN